MKKIYSPVRVTTEALSPANELVIDLENRYTYTNLDELRITWTYGEEKGTAFADLEPGEKGQLRIRLAHPERRMSSICLLPIPVALLPMSI